MKTPIFAVERGGDIVAFKNIENAEQYLEPPDIASGVYEIFDSGGGRLRPVIETEEKKF